MQWQDRIGANPNVCHGKPCIDGTRVMVSYLASSEEDVAWDLPWFDGPREYSGHVTVFTAR